MNTLMEPHESEPYNPDIAGVFYRAGFIETWGQGIQKICDECRDPGADIPSYEPIGTTLRIRFHALESALIDQPQVPKHQSTKDDGALEDAMVLKVIEVLKEQPDRGNPLDVVTICPANGKYFNDCSLEELAIMANSFDKKCIGFLKDAGIL